MTHKRTKKKKSHPPEMSLETPLQKEFGRLNLWEKATATKPREKVNFLLLPDHLQTFHVEGELKPKHSLTSSSCIRDAAPSCHPSHNQQVFLQAEQAIPHRLTPEHVPSLHLQHALVLTLLGTPSRQRSPGSVRCHGHATWHKDEKLPIFCE